MSHRTTRTYVNVSMRPSRTVGATRSPYDCKVNSVYTTARRVTIVLGVIALILVLILK